MKKVFFQLVLLALGVSIASAQLPATRLGVWTLKTYAANQSDTSKSLNISGAALASLGYKYDDSTNVISLVQYSKDAGATWAFIAGDTLNHTGGGTVSGSTYRELVLRSATVDKFAGVGGLIRIVQNFQATLCGVTTPRYTVWMNVAR
jgi:hypothetical protein